MGSFFLGHPVCLGGEGDEALIPVNLELVNLLWLPNIFVYNLKTFKVVEVLSKHAGLWITTNNDVFYSQATHITFICPMRFDAFPLDTQVKLKITAIVIQIIFSIRMHI